MIRFKIIADFKKEEQYLNDMARKGWRFKRNNLLGIYIFRRSEPRDLRYKIDYRTFSNKAQFKEYRTLFEDKGWAHVCGTHRSGLQYFLPILDKQQVDDVFANDESKAKRYKRFLAIYLGLLILLNIHFIIYMPGDWSFWDLRSWYLIEGLWDMTGTMFWKAFLLETFIKIIWTVPFVSIAFMAGLNGYWAIKTLNLYKKIKQ